MPTVVIPYSNNRRLVLTDEEAEELIASAQKALQTVREKTSGLRPVQQRQGYITRDDVFAFFSQVYPEQGMLRVHAGRVFVRLVTVATDYRGETPLLTVVCGRCGKSVEKKCPKTRFRHYYNYYVSYRVDVDSLKTNAERITSLDNELITPGVRDDLTLLIRYL